MTTGVMSSVDGSFDKKNMHDANFMTVKQLTVTAITVEVIGDSDLIFFFQCYSMFI
jgi:hypothetical protein